MSITVTDDLEFMQKFIREAGSCRSFSRREKRREMQKS